MNNQQDADVKTVAQWLRGVVKIVGTLLAAILLTFLAIAALGGIGYLIYKYMTIVHVLSLVIITLIAALIVACYYLYKFANVILVFEEDLSTTIEALNECEDSLENVISLRLFFENEQVRPILEAAKEEVGMCRMKVRQMAQRFVERSKQQYVVYEEPIEVEKIRDIPGAIDDELITNRIMGYKQELGEDADVMFATPEEMQAARRYRRSGR